MGEMATIAPANRKEFSLHEEDHLTETRSHGAQAVYLEYALDQLLPGWFVARNFAVYWVPGQRQYPYAGPDVLVSRHHPQRQEDPSVYLTYEDGPLTLVAEIASDKTRRREPKKRDETYARELQVPEYLFVDIPRDILQFSVLTAGRYEPVLPDAAGRLWSPALGIGFAWQEDHRLVRVIAPDGAVMPTAQEAAALLTSAAAQAEAERQRADALAAELERLRRARDEKA
jgi:Uma2 family endonuclease